MGFFDLNIPYLESPPSNNTAHKTARVKIVIKAMELGYSGIAYNRMIKGVMSDNDRCSISLLSLSSLLKVTPSLSSSVNFHRDLLGVPPASPFRQYTRLTVCADSHAQSQVLNSGNPVLKTYDIVAVRPLNQNVFDHACEKAEVDIISINFAERMPFRLKQPMVKAAIERGVYFELTYSDLILDLQLRRQMISNAKLLVDWTRGKNLIFSSGAPSVNELRGPYDVANLSSLLGLSVERAKAAVSKNCRTLLTNAIRKKHFFKETIRVEALSSGERTDSKEPWSGDWLKWDPISSGEGDLQLDELAKSFTASSKESKTVKAIDFASVMCSMPSQGFQVKDLMFGTQAVSHSRDKDSGKQILSTTETVETSVATGGVSEKQTRLNLLPETDQASLDNAPPKPQSFGCEEAQKLGLPSDFAEMVISSEDIGTRTTTTMEELNNPDMSNELFAANNTERYNQYSQNCIPSREVDVVLSKEILKCQTLTRCVELDAVSNLDANLEGVAPCNAFDFPASQNEESKSVEHSDAQLGSQKGSSGEVRMEIDIKAQEDTSSALNDESLLENVTETEHFREPVDDQVASDQNLFQESSIEIKVKDDSSVLSHANLEKVTMEEQQGGDKPRETGDHGLLVDQILVLESSSEIAIKDDSAVENHMAQDEFTMEDLSHGEQIREPAVGIVADQTLFMDSWKIRSKPRLHQRAPLFPLKRLLSPISFKKKARRLKNRIKKT
ncbi:hypothetical protein Patl1_30823 [Pistacia atlantica]|uniref:Uncharacterized protein n=1 Tax=Pistacia atlantica TaxID=434234 RepID=A0ACC1AAI7_9ROSI|nr:hypothetical protein Patl1_30823 [Pistacia atlantica]